ncbi:MAG: hypothetical protein V4662_02780 [Verrucomicrobiota bacterium]
MKASHQITILYVLFMVTWYLIDWIDVRVLKQGKVMPPIAAVLLSVPPILAGLVTLIKNKQSPILKRALIAVGTTLIFAFLCLVGILFLGLPFHVWLGGTL